MVRVSVVAPLALVLGSCGLFSGADETRAKLISLRERVLADVVQSVVISLEAAGEKVASRAEDLATKRASVHYRMRTVMGARGSLAYLDPRVGMLDLWAAVEQVLHGLHGDGAKERFGELRGILIEAAEESLAAVEASATNMLTEEQLAFAREDVEIVARAAEDRDFDDPFVRIGYLEGAKETSLGWLRSAVSLRPLNPFATVGGSITEGADVVTVAMDRASRTAEMLPRQLGWQAELLIYDLQEMRQLGEITGGIQTVTERVGELVGVAKELPDRLREAVEEVLQSSGTTLREVRAALAAVRETAGPVEEIGETYAATAGRIEEMSEQVALALESFRETYRMLKEPSDEGDAASEGAGEHGGAEAESGFDIREWDRAARSIAMMSANLDRTFAEFQDTVGDRDLENRIQQVQGAAQETLAAATWRGLAAAMALIAAFYVVRTVFVVATRSAGSRRDRRNDARTTRHART